MGGVTCWFVTSSWKIPHKVALLTEDSSQGNFNQDNLVTKATIVTEVIMVTKADEIFHAGILHNHFRTQKPMQIFM
jgi:hypothetical protein